VGLLLRKLRARLSDVPTGFVWIEKDRVAASGYPASRGQLEWVSDRGIESILSLTENPLPREWLEGLPLRVEHIAMSDHGLPERETLDRAARYIQSEVEEGLRILVHCMAGRGRTGCAVAAYLIKNRGIGASEAIRALRTVRPGFIESRQEKAIYDYASRSAKGPSDELDP